VDDAAVYFVTVCAAQRGLNHFCHPVIGAEMLRSIRFYSEKGRWFCHLAVLMPDHVHLLLSFPETLSFARIIGDWKGWLNRHHSISWQENFFDHRLRDEENFEQKAEYILHNPVRAHLVSAAKDWPYTWISPR